MGLFRQNHRLDAEPQRTKEAAYQRYNDGLERPVLGLLDALAPTPKMDEIGAEFGSVFFLDTERGQDGGDCS